MKTARQATQPATPAKKALTPERSYAMRCVNLSMGYFFRKMYSKDGTWFGDVNKQEIRDLLNAPGYLLIFKHDATRTIQIVSYRATPAGWPEEALRFEIPFAPF